MRRVCGAHATGQCVYCGALFCDTHGRHLEDYHEVCVRKECQAKWSDLLYHREWVKRQYRRNLQGMCAVDECREDPEVGCQRCQLRFCFDHVEPKTVTQRRMEMEMREQQMLCPHCAERRKIWD